MDPREYDIVYSGALVAGRDPAHVKSELARLFKTDAAGVERLFSGQTVIIKKAVDRQTAEKYRAVMQKAGAVCEIRDRTEAPKDTTAAPSVASAGRMTIAPAGEILTTPRTVSSPAYDFAHMSVAAAGADILDDGGAVAAAPLYDLSALSMAPPGIDLIEQRRVDPAPLPDFSGMNIADAGVDLDTRTPPAAAAQPDISAIALAPAGTVMLRPGEMKTPPAPPDISALDLSLERTV
ncbi:MAG: hypothetical protein AB7Q01_05275 [Gammaproteobacteria bacterium]